MNEFTLCYTKPVKTGCHVSAFQRTLYNRHGFQSVLTLSVTSLSDITHKLNYANLQGDAQAVIAS